MKKPDIKVIDRREFLTFSGAVAGAALGASAVHRAWADAGAGVASLVAREAGKFSILAVTDLHFNVDQEDAKTVADIGKMVAHFRPDLIVVTGDMCYENPQGRGLELCKFACESFAGLKTPWAFARGNHDKADDYAACQALLASSPFSLYRGSASQSNYRVDIKGPGDERPFWTLLLVDDAHPEQGFREPQISWLRAESERIRAQNNPPPPAFLFCHIPVPEYEAAAHSADARGVKLEKVAFEKAGPGLAFSAIKEAGFIKAMFCGHDHMNNYYGTVEGLGLGYIRSTGQGGYGGDSLKKGATLISVDASKAPAFSTATVFPSGRSFQPRAMIRIS